jgi:aryl-alcohol dehydrogenase-like predicted oxidoreductase
MRHIDIGGLKKPVSVVGLGTSTAAFSPENSDKAADLLEAFLDAGGNCIDTAHIYGFGNSERALGRWFAETGRRNEVVLITKGCHPVVDPDDVFAKPWLPRVTPEAIHADLGESLDRLQTDQIELYLLHRDDESQAVGPLIEALNEEQERGRIAPPRRSPVRCI